MGYQLLSVIGVVHGKARKFVVAARNHATVLRSIRYSYLISPTLLASRVYLVCGIGPRSTLPFYKKETVFQYNFVWLGQDAPDIRSRAYFD
jgi:hypothetical protein